MATFRSKETEERYRQYRQNKKDDGVCVLCEREPIQVFTNWKIIENIFPYDRVAKVHHMVIPIRHVKEDGLTEEEREELRMIKKSYINDTYEAVIEATTKQKTIPEHFHLHLVIVKEAE